MKMYVNIQDQLFGITTTYHWLSHQGGAVRMSRPAEIRLSSGVYQGVWSPVESLLYKTVRAGGIIVYKMKMLRVRQLPTFPLACSQGWFPCFCEIRGTSALHVAPSREAVNRTAATSPWPHMHMSPSWRWPPSTKLKSVSRTNASLKK